MKSLLLILLTVAYFTFYFQPVVAVEPDFNSNAVLSGYIKDAATGETLIGATVYAKELRVGTITNVYGFYSLSLPPGHYNLNVSYVGYTPFEKEMKVEIGRAHV